MSDRVIEPSEIIVERETKPKENASHVNPWIRFLARGVDYSLFFFFLQGLKTLFRSHLNLSHYEYLIPFEFFVWIPIEALFLSTWGTTPGKFFLKTQLKQGKKKRLEYRAALKRSFSVWFRGLGMGIAVINFICLAIAYHNLKLYQMTSWDRDDHIQITHYPIGRWRIYAAVFIAALGFFQYYSWKGH